MAWKFRRFRFAPLEKLRGGRIMLSLGIPAEEAVARPSARRISLQYPPFSGMEVLKERLMEFAGIGDAILITSGSQQALDIISRSTRGKIWVEDISYFAGLDVFRLNGRKIMPFTDLSGLEPEEGDIIYLIPDFSNPTGRLMPQKERREIADIANRSGAVVVEDITYRHLYFDRKPGRMVSEYADSYAVVGTLSKVFGGGLRIGFICSDIGAISRFSKVKSAMDIATSSPSQLIAVHLMEDIDSQLRFLREYYRAKRDDMREIGRKIKAGKEKPVGGFFLWLETDRDMTAAFPEIVERGVSYVPGEFFSLTGRKNGMRLSFSYESIERIREGMEILLEWFNN